MDSERPSGAADRSIVIIEGRPPKRLAGPLETRATPEASALRRALSSLVEADPGKFPIRGSPRVGVVLTSSKEIPDEDAAIIEAIEDELIGAGVIESDALEWDRFEIDPKLVNRYSIEIVWAAS